MHQEEECIGKLKKCQEIQDKAFEKLKKVLNIEEDTVQPKHEDLPDEDDEVHQFADKENMDNSHGDRSKRSGSADQLRSVD